MAAKKAVREGLGTRLCNALTLVIIIKKVCLTDLILKLNCRKVEARLLVKLYGVLIWGSSNLKEN